MVDDDHAFWGTDDPEVAARFRFEEEPLDASDSDGGANDAHNGKNGTGGWCAALTRSDLTPVHPERVLARGGTSAGAVKSRDRVHTQTRRSGRGDETGRERT